MRGSAITAMLVSVFSQMAVIGVLTLRYVAVTWHLDVASAVLFWEVYPISISLLGTLIPLLCLWLSSKWYYGLTSSAIAGFVVLMGFSLLTYYLMLMPDSRARVFLPLVAGIAEAYYFAGILLGTALAYMLSRLRQHP